MKIVFFTLIKFFLLLIILLMNGFGAVFADNKLLINESVNIYQSQEYKDFKINNEGRIEPYVIQQKLLLNDFDLKKDLNTVTKIKFNYDKYNLLHSFDLFPIDWSVISENNPDWLQDNTNFESNSSKPLFLSLSKPNFNNQIESLDNYDEMWIDYDYQYGANSSLCNINSILNFNGRPNASYEETKLKKESWVAFYGGNNFKAIKFRADAEDSQYLKKDYKYLLARILGLKSDNQWRITKDDLSLVLQRQMNWPISNNSLLKINHSNSSKLKGVNISVKFDNDIGLGKMISIPVLDSSQLSISEFGVELDLAPHLNAAFPEMIEYQNKLDGPQAFLQEIFLHFDENDEEKFTRSRDLKSVSLIDTVNLNVNNFENYKKIESVEPLESEWKESTYINILKELFDDKSDFNSWNWTQKKSVFEVEKFLNWNINPNSKIIIYVQPNTNISNVSIQFGEDKSTVKTIYDPVLTELPSGKFAVIVDLSNDAFHYFLNSLKEDKKIRPLLKKINISFLGSADEVILNRKLREVALLEDELSYLNVRNIDFSSSINRLNLPASYEITGFQKSRSIFDLSHITNVTSDLAMEDSFIILSSPNQNLGCNIKINSIFLAKKYTDKKLAYMDSIEQLSKSYGGTFLPLKSRHASIEGLKFLAYTSPFSFYSDKANYEKITNVPFDQSGDILLDQITSSLTNQDSSNPSIYVLKNYSDQNLEDKWISVDGIELSSSGNIISTSPYKENFSKNIDDSKSELFHKGLIIRGKGANASMFWPTKVSLVPNSRFYLSILEGNENIYSVNLIIKGKDGSQWQELIMANQPVSLSKAPQEVESVEIKLTFKDFNFEFALGEMSIFTPILLSSKEALMIEVPRKESQILEIGSSSEGVKVEDRKNIINWSTEVSNGLIETLIPDNLSWIENIGINYQIPSSWFDIDSCILKGDFVYSNKTVRRTFCLNQPQGSYSFTTGELGLIGYGKLEKIIWNFQKPLGSNDSVNLNIWVDKWGRSSFYDYIKHTPLFHFDGTPYYLDSLNNKELISSFGLEHRLPQSFISDYFENANLLEINDNPWVKIQRISIKPNDNVSFNKWKSLIEPTEFKKAFNWVGLLAIILLSSVLFFLYKMNSISKLSSNFFKFTGVIYSKFFKFIRVIYFKFPKVILNKIWVYTLFISRPLNLLVGFIFTPSIVWFSSGIDDIFIRYTLLLSALLLGFNVYRHWVQFGIIEKRTGEAIWRDFVWVLLGFSLLLLLFFIKINNFQIQWVLFFPFLAIFYGLLPEIIRTIINLYNKSPNLIKAIFWGMFSIVLYLIGIFNELKFIENYFFIFGGLLFVISWSYLIEYLKSSINSKWPLTGEKIYGSPGTKYFVGFLLTFIIISGLLVIKLDPIAGQVGVIGFYMLVMGLISETFSIKKYEANINPVKDL